MEERSVKRKSGLSAAFVEDEADSRSSSSSSFSSSSSSSSSSAVRSSSAFPSSFSDAMKRPHIEAPSSSSSSSAPSSSSTSQSKRKQSSQTDDASLTEQIKRFRITNTPGELRLQKDMKELSGRTDVQFHYPEEPGSVVLTFQSHPLYLYVPAVFRVNVPRFYPHNAPTVQCLDEEYSATGTVTCPYILPTGELLHEGLGEAWSAIGSLATVVDIIHSVRASLQQNPHLVVQHHGNPEMFHAPRGSSSSSSNNNGGGGQGGPDAMQSSPPSSSSASAPGGGAGADASSGAGPGGSHEYLMQTGPWTGDSVARVEFMSVPPMRPMHADAMDADIMMDGDTDDDATGIP